MPETYEDLPLLQGNTDGILPDGWRGYVPALQSKVGEFEALQHASATVWKQITPWIRVSQRRAPPRPDPRRGQARIAFGDVSRSTDSRTVRACLVPPRTPPTNKAPYLIFSGWGALERTSVLGVLNSLPFDWLARRYIETNVNFFILDMLGFPRWEDTAWQRVGELAARLSCVDERFTYFAAEAGVECALLGDDERETMRAEIDALVARGYGLVADELRFVFEDFTEDAVTPAYRARVMAAFDAL